MKIVEKKKINEGFNDYDELRRAVWDIANGMSMIDNLRKDAERFIDNVEAYFNAVQNNDIKKVSLIESFIKDSIKTLRKEYKL